MKLKVLRFLDVAVEHSVYGLIFFIPISIAGIGTFAGMATVFFLFKKILSPDFSSIKSNKVLFLLLMLFFIFMGLSLFNSGTLIIKSINALFLKWGKFILVFLVVVDTFRDSKRVVKAVYVLLFSATLVGFSVLSQKLFGCEFLRGRPLSQSFVTGPFKNQNGLAAYLVCMIPIALSLSLCKRKRITVNAIFLLIAGMLVVSLLWTISRGAWLGLMVGGIFIMLITVGRSMKKLIFIPTVLLASFFYFPLLKKFLSPGANYGRLIISHGAWGMIKEHPLLGMGIGTFMDYCARYTNNFGTYYAHNCFLQIWAESGFFSLFCFILFAGYAIYKCIKAILKMPESLNFFLLIGLSAALLGFLTHSFFDNQLYSFQLSFLFWVILGLTIDLAV